MKGKILLIADFQDSGGTLTYFKQLLSLLLEYRDLRIEVFLKPAQLHIIRKLLNGRESNLKWITTEIPEWRLSKYIGIRLNYYMNVVTRYAFWLYYCVTRRPQLVIHSTGGKLNYYLFVLPVNVLAIQHSSQFYRFSRIKQLILNIFLNNKKRILTVSRYSKRCILDAGTIRGDRRGYVDYIYNCHSAARCIREDARAITTILTIGHVVEYKNPEFWYQVAKVITRNYGASVRFLWVGSGELLEMYRQRTLGNDNIVFFGHSDDVDELYANCDIYFQPSVLESHGIAVLGAMAHAIPCVVSNVGGLPESVIDGETGFVYKSGDLNAACEKIVSILEDDVLGERLGTQGRMRFDEMFSLEKWKVDMFRFLSAHYDLS